jgi:hypothetical protein
MNNTHYALINEDKDVVAVIRKEDFKGRIIKAIEDETGDSVTRVTFEQIDYNTYSIKASMLDIDTEFIATLVATWEY